MRKLPSYCLVETNFRGTAVAAFLSSKGAIGIDTPLCPQDADLWRRRIQEKGSGLVFSVQMDSSPDRAYAASYLPTLYESEVPALIACQQTADAFKGMQDSLKNSPLLAGLEATQCGLEPMSVRWPRPIIVFPKEIIFHWDDALIVVRHAPATSPGACWVHLPEEDILMVGDCIALTLPPLLHEARFDVWLATLAELRKAQYKKCRILCSHGGWVDADQVAGFARFLQAAQKKLTAVRDASSSQKEIQQAARVLLEHFHVSADRRDFALVRLQTGLQAVWDREHSSSAEKSSASGG
jgi:glyoxylase-like metal-dependent hydrolase (beta-lactamase superfamily II)